MIKLEFLHGREKLDPTPVVTFLKYLDSRGPDALTDLNLPFPAPDPSIDWIDQLGAMFEFTFL